MWFFFIIVVVVLSFSLIVIIIQNITFTMRYPAIAQAIGNELALKTKLKL